MIEGGPAGHRPSRSGRLEAALRSGAAVHADRRRRPGAASARGRLGRGGPVGELQLLAEGQHAPIGRSAAARASSTASREVLDRARTSRTTKRSTPPSRSPSICLAEGGPDRRVTEVEEIAGRRAERADRAGDQRRRDRRRRVPRARAGPRDGPACRPGRPGRMGASRTRFAPNVAVSMRSAPAARYSRWMAPIRSGRIATSSSSDARWGIPREYRSVPIAPSARSGPRASRSRNLARPSTREE